MITLNTSFRKTTFRYRVKPDFSGQIEITRTKPGGNLKIQIPAKDMLNLVGLWLRLEVATRLSTTSILELLDSLLPRRKK
jgi:hypothetical protein